MKKIKASDVLMVLAILALSVLCFWILNREYNGSAYYVVSNNEQYNNILYKEVNTKLVDVLQVRDGSSYLYIANYNDENVAVDLNGEYNTRMFLHEMTSNVLRKILLGIASLGLGFILFIMGCAVWYASEPFKE